MTTDQLRNLKALVELRGKTAQRTAAGVDQLAAEHRRLQRRWPKPRLGTRARARWRAHHGRMRRELANAEALLRNHVSHFRQARAHYRRARLAFWARATWATLTTP